MPGSRKKKSAKTKTHRPMSQRASSSASSSFLASPCNNDDHRHARFRKLIASVDSGIPDKNLDSEETKAWICDPEHNHVLMRCVYNYIFEQIPDFEKNMKRFMALAVSDMAQVMKAMQSTKRVIVIALYFFRHLQASPGAPNDKLLYRLTLLAWSLRGPLYFLHEIHTGYLCPHGTLAWFRQSQEFMQQAFFTIYPMLLRIITRTMENEAMPGMTKEDRQFLNKTMSGFFILAAGCLRYQARNYVFQLDWAGFHNCWQKIQELAALVDLEKISALTQHLSPSQLKKNLKPVTRSSKLFEALSQLSREPESPGFHLLELTSRLYYMQTTFDAQLIGKQISRTEHHDTNDILHRIHIQMKRHLATPANIQAIWSLLETDLMPVLLRWYDRDPGIRVRHALQLNAIFALFATIPRTAQPAEILLLEQLMDYGHSLQKALQPWNKELHASMEQSGNQFFKALNQDIIHNTPYPQSRIRAQFAARCDQWGFALHLEKRLREKEHTFTPQELGLLIQLSASSDKTRLIHEQLLVQLYQPIKRINSSKMPFEQVRAMFDVWNACLPHVFTMEPNDYLDEKDISLFYCHTIDIFVLECLFYYANGHLPVAHDRFQALHGHLERIRDRLNETDYAQALLNMNELQAGIQDPPVSVQLLHYVLVQEGEIEDRIAIEGEQHPFRDAWQRISGAPQNGLSRQEVRDCYQEWLPLLPDLPGFIDSPQSLENKWKQCYQRCCSRFDELSARPSRTKQHQARPTVTDDVKPAVDSAPAPVAAPDAAEKESPGLAASRNTFFAPAASSSQSSTQPPQDTPEIPTHIQIMNDLSNAGYFVLISGGYVRDTLLGLQPNDVDLVTNCPPPELQRLITNCIIDNKIPNLCYVAVSPGELRIDIKHLSLSELCDALTQGIDFRINAMFMTRHHELLTPLPASLDDLSRRRLKPVAPSLDLCFANITNIWRMVRLNNRMSGTLDDVDRATILKFAPQLCHISFDQFMGQFNRCFLTCDIDLAIRNFDSFYELGLSASLFANKVPDYIDPLRFLLCRDHLFIVLQRADDNRFQDCLVLFALLVSEPFFAGYQQRIQSWIASFETREHNPAVIRSLKSNLPVRLQHYYNLLMQPLPGPYYVPFQYEGYTPPAQQEEAPSVYTINRNVMYAPAPTGFGFDYVPQDQEPLQSPVSIRNW